MKVTVQSKEERRREAQKEGEKEREREGGSLSEGAQLFLCKLSHLRKTEVKKTFILTLNLLFNNLI